MSLKDNELTISKIVSEYDQEIPQSQTADNPLAQRGRAAQPSKLQTAFFYHKNCRRNRLLNMTTPKKTLCTVKTFSFKT